MRADAEKAISGQVEEGKQPSLVQQLRKKAVEPSEWLALLGINDTEKSVSEHAGLASEVSEHKVGGVEAGIDDLVKRTEDAWTLFKLQPADGLAALEQMFAEAQLVLKKQPDAQPANLLFFKVEGLTLLARAVAMSFIESDDHDTPSLQSLPGYQLAETALEKLVAHFNAVIKVVQKKAQAGHGFIGRFKKKLPEEELAKQLSEGVDNGRRLAEIKSLQALIVYHQARYYLQLALTGLPKDEQGNLQDALEQIDKALKIAPQEQNNQISLYGELRSEILVQQAMLAVKGKRLPLLVLALPCAKAHYLIACEIGPGGVHQGMGAKFYLQKAVEGFRRGKSPLPGQKYKEEYCRAHLDAEWLLVQEFEKSALPGAVVNDDMQQAIVCCDQIIALAKVVQLPKPQQLAKEKEVKQVPGSASALQPELPALLSIIKARKKAIDQLPVLQQAQFGYNEFFKTTQDRVVKYLQDRNLSWANAYLDASSLDVLRDMLVADADALQRFPKIKGEGYAALLAWVTPEISAESPTLPAEGKGRPVITSAAILSSLHSGSAASVSVAAAASAPDFDLGSAAPVRGCTPASAVALRRSMSSGSVLPVSSHPAGLVHSPGSIAPVCDDRGDAVQTPTRSPSPGASLREF